MKASHMRDNEAGQRVVCARLSLDRFADVVRQCHPKSDTVGPATQKARQRQGRAKIRFRPHGTSDEIMSQARVYVSRLGAGSDYSVNCVSF